MLTSFDIFTTTGCIYLHVICFLMRQITITRVLYLYAAVLVVILLYELELFKTNAK